MSSEQIDDCLIIGGGVIGLSLAYELAQHGRRVRIAERGAVGQESSWAGAGILPPAGAGGPLDPLFALSNDLHRDWAARLREETGIDNGYRRCGGIYLPASDEDRALLAVDVASWRAAGATVETITPGEVPSIEPALRPPDAAQSATLVPDEAQIRNPRHVQALSIACRRLGVQVDEGIEVDDFRLSGDRIVEATTKLGPIRAGQFCLAAGAWSGGVARRLGLEVRVRPIRGQIALLATPQPLLSRIVYIGRRYLVPRDDGRVLAGSTLEDVGFERGNTPGAIHDLLQFAIDLAPQLFEATLERCWSGLRPASADGLPYLGRMPNFENGFVATGHYRSGLQLSPGTAVVMRQLMCGERPQLDLAALRIDRHPAGSESPLAPNLR